jgi:hypothetical protein
MQSGCSSFFKSMLTWFTPHHTISSQQWRFSNTSSQQIQIFSTSATYTSHGLLVGSSRLRKQNGCLTSFIDFVCVILHRPIRFYICHANIGWGDMNWQHKCLKWFWSIIRSMYFRWNSSPKRWRKRCSLDIRWTTVVSKFVSCVRCRCLIHDVNRKHVCNIIRMQKCETME